LLYRGPLRAAKKGESLGNRNIGFGNGSRDRPAGMGRAPGPDFAPLCRVVLVEPLIPENTGNVARTCVGTRSELHLVGPLGFEITESRV
jgi:hypothetical protein